MRTKSNTAAGKQKETKIQRIRKVRAVVMIFSMILFPVSFYYLSPVISLYGSSLGIVTGSVLVFLGLFLSGVFFGRSFCSWACPAGGIQDCVGDARTQPVKVRRVSWLKYVVWGVWLFMLFLFFRRAGGVKGIEFAFSTEMGLSTTSVPALISYSMVVFVFFLLSLVVGRRAGCHTLCWMAPFMVIGRKLGFAMRLPSLRLKTDPDRCVSCGRCTEACPMSLDVERLMRKGEIRENNCILCGACIAVCRRGVIEFAWKTKKGVEL